MSFPDILESIQYDAYLVITGALRGTSKDKFYQELGSESLVTTLVKKTRNV